MNYRLKAALAVSVGTLLSGYAIAQNVAVVNGKPVPTSRMDAFVAQVAKQGRPVDDQMRKQIRDEVISREVFAQEAAAKGIDASDDFKMQMENARQVILIRELFADYQKKNPVSDAEVKAEYDKFVAASGGREYKARHVLVEKEDEAKAIIASLKKGGKFEDIAKKQSKDPGSGANGGDLDWAPSSAYVKEFSDAMTKLAKGKYTETPVKSQFGWHVIRVDDVREAKLPTLDQVRPQVKQQLEEKKLAEYQDSLRKKAKIE
jgi:peptidyl-prolyl cis-trans isomerase C